MIQETTTKKKYPLLKDSISYIYIEHAVIEQDAFSIAKVTEEGRTPIPIAGITCLLLGPGTTITHAAMRSIADCGCTVIWCGDKMRKFYAYGEGDTKSGKNILHQANLLCDEYTHLQVVKKMYLLRFPGILQKDYSLEQLRGLEGVRVRQSYKTSSKLYGVPWSGRNSRMKDIEEGDSINRALTLSSDLLYGICHSAIVSLGYSPALGFIHTGNARSFVFDVADFYKVDIAIPAAFEAVANTNWDLDSTVRRCCRKRFVEKQFLKRIANDIETVFDVETQKSLVEEGLWNDGDIIAYGHNYGGKT